MQIADMRKVAAHVLTALILAAAVFTGAVAVTDTVNDEQAGTRIGSSSGTREST